MNRGAELPQPTAPDFAGLLGAVIRMSNWETVALLLENDAIMTYSVVPTLAMPDK